MTNIFHIEANMRFMVVLATAMLTASCSSTANFPTNAVLRCSCSPSASMLNVVSNVALAVGFQGDNSRTLQNTKFLTELAIFYFPGAALRIHVIDANGDLKIIVSDITSGSGFTAREIEIVRKFESDMVRNFPHKFYECHFDYSNGRRLCATDATV